MVSIVGNLKEVDRLIRVECLEVEAFCVGRYSRVSASERMILFRRCCSERVTSGDHNNSAAKGKM